MRPPVVRGNYRKTLLGNSSTIVQTCHRVTSRPPVVRGNYRTTLLGNTSEIGTNWLQAHGEANTTGQLCFDDLYRVSQSFCDSPTLP